MYSEMIEEFLFFTDSYEAAICKCTVAEETSNVDETGNDTDNSEHAWEQMKLSRRVRAKKKRSSDEENDTQQRKLPKKYPAFPSLLSKPTKIPSNNKAGSIKQINSEYIIII